jgi:hypothetical protein
MKSPSDAIGSQTRYVPAPSALPQPTAPPRNQIYSNLTKIFRNLTLAISQTTMSLRRNWNTETDKNFQLFRHTQIPPSRNSIFEFVFRVESRAEHSEL